MIVFGITNAKTCEEWYENIREWLNEIIENAVSSNLLVYM